MSVTEALARLMPAFAARVAAYPADRAVAQVPVADLRPGDVALVRPGETIPADGVVVEGASAANEALLYARLVAAGSTPVSISHRPALLAYHQQVLRLHGDGGWSLHPARSHRFGEGGADAA